MQNQLVDLALVELELLHGLLSEWILTLDLLRCSLLQHEVHLLFQLLSLLIVLLSLPLLQLGLNFQLPCVQK